MALIEKQISNHPVTGLERKLVIWGDKVNDKSEEYDLYYEIEHYFNGNKMPLSITSDNKRWLVDNNYKAIVRDGNFDPVPNQDYTPEYEVVGKTERPVDWDDETDGEFEPELIYGETVINESDQYMQMPAYDYFKMLTFDNPNPVSISLLLNYYIEDNDSKGFFDFY